MILFKFEGVVKLYNISYENKLFFYLQITILNNIFLITNNNSVKYV